MPFKRNTEINLSSLSFSILLLLYIFYSQNQINDLKREINELDEIAMINEGHLIRRIEKQDSSMVKVLEFIKLQNKNNHVSKLLHEEITRSQRLLFESIQLHHPIDN